jgi:hypothetical protein
MKITFASLFAVLAVACSHAAPAPTPAEVAAQKEAAKAFSLQRAAFDAKCDATKMTATDLGNDKYGVRGCDQVCTYTVTCANAAKCEAIEANCEKDGAAK